MCYKMKDTSGWQLLFESEVQTDDIYRLAMTARSSSTSSSTGTTVTSQQAPETMHNLRESKLVAIAVRTNVRLWNIVDATAHTTIGTFAFGGPIDNLFFINSQLVATGDEKKVGVWHSLSQQWQTQELTRVLSFDTVSVVIVHDSHEHHIIRLNIRQEHFFSWAAKQDRFIISICKNFR
jgi:BTB/POZ domain-containing protein KCTD3